MIRTYQVSFGFKKDPDTVLDNRAGSVIVCLTENEAYPNLPIPLFPVTTVTNAGPAEAQTVIPNNLTAIHDNFHDALLASAQGGQEATAAKNEARVLLEEALSQEALYIQNIATHNLSMLLSSGFEAKSTNHASGPLGKPEIQKIVSGLSGQLVLRGSVIVNANGFMARMKNGAGEWVDLGYYSQSRRMVMKNLTPGSTYTFQIRAVGAGGDSSDWSDAVAHMAT
jgi:hypothetical protein